MDSGCSNSMAFVGACSEGLCAEGVCIASGGRCDRAASRLPAVKVTVGPKVKLLGISCGDPAAHGALDVCDFLQVEKATMTDGLFPEPVRVRPKERGGRWGHASPFMRGSTIVRSQTFSPGARSQYVCRVSVRRLLPRWLTGGFFVQ